MLEKERMKTNRQIWNVVKREKVWLLLLLCTDLISAFFLWLAGMQQFLVLAGLEGICFVLLFFGAVLWKVREEQKQVQALRAFLAEPGEEIGRAFGMADRDLLDMIGQSLQEARKQADEGRIQLEEYERYVEAWAHEIKIPLSLLTLLLENRQDEISPSVCKKLEYVRLQMYSYVEQMLYYARIKAVNKEYVFEEIDLEECCQEVLNEYQMYLEEKKFTVNLQLEEKSILSDQKSLCFLLSQVISNSIKYTGKDTEKQPQIRIYSGIKNHRVHLTVSDNGCGVKPYEMPYLFEKGFTGENSQKKSTGMGLYLVKQLAQELNIEVEAISVYQKGMKIRFWFPMV